MIAPKINIAHLEPSHQKLTTALLALTLHIPTLNHWMIASLVPMVTIVFQVLIRQIAPRVTTVQREPKLQISTHAQWVSILTL